MKRTALGVWFGLIDGMAWLGSQRAATVGFLAGAVYGVLMANWLLR